MDLRLVYGVVLVILTYNYSSLLSVAKFFPDDTALVISGKSFKIVQMFVDSSLPKGLNWMMAYII